MKASPNVDEFGFETIGNGKIDRRDFALRDQTPASNSRVQDDALFSGSLARDVCSVNACDGDRPDNLVRCVRDLP